MLASLMPRFLKRLLGGALRRSGYQLVNIQKIYDFDGLHTVHHARFLEDPKFRSAWEGAFEAAGRGDARSSWRIHIGVWAASLAARAAGDFVECGVNAGYLSSAIVRYLDWNQLGKRFYLVDTFAGPVLSQFSAEEIQGGLREAVEKSVVEGGYVLDADAVRRNYRGWDGIEVVQGVVPDILPSLTTERVAFLHLDMNCAYPECEALRFFWERMGPGAVVLMDDYSYFGYEAQGRLLDAVARELGTTILALPTGQGLIVK